MSLDLFARLTLSTRQPLALSALLATALACSSGAATAGCKSGNNTNNGSLLISADCQASAVGTNATAVGNTARAAGFGGTAFGFDAAANAARTTAVGTSSGYLSAPNEGATTIGAGVGVLGAGYYSVAVGGGGGLNEETTIALGIGSVAIGGGYTNQPGARADGNFSIAVGNKSIATGQGYATSLGYNAKADVGLGPTVIGTDAKARGTGAAAMGRFSFAAAESSTALGAGAWAKRQNSVALGAGSVAEAANIVSIGTPADRRRIVNVAKAVDGTDAVNLAQVNQLIAAAAVNSKLGLLTPMREHAAASARQLASLGDIAITPQRARPAAPTVSVACEFGGGKVVTAGDEQQSESAAFTAIGRSSISFTQAGAENGCVTLSFSAEILALAGSVMEVRAVMDDGIEASPGPVLFAQGDGVAHSRAFTFLFPNVTPGAHRVELQFRNAGEGGFVRIGQRTTMVQFAK